LGAEYTTHVEEQEAIQEERDEDVAKEVTERTMNAKTTTNTGSVSELKRIMNDVVQIKELRQHLQTLSHEIIDDLTAMLQLASAEGLPLTAWGRAVTLYPNGFLLAEEPDGGLQSQHLRDLEPPQLHSLMQQLIPSISENLRDAKQTQESLASDLEAIHDTLTENL
jgi:hypothetical protein